MDSQNYIRVKNSYISLNSKEIFETLVAKIHTPDCTADCTDLLARANTLQPERIIALNS